MATDIYLRFKGDATSAVRAAAVTRGSLDRVGSAGQRLGRILTTATVAGTAALAFGLGKALSVAGDFEAALNTFQAVSEATGRQMERVSGLAKRLGADLTLPGTSAKDAADTMTELAKGGLSVAEAMDAARGTIKLSTAAQIENAEAATIVADALNAFGLRGDAAGKVADLLAASANATTAEIGDMAAALKQSSAVAAQLGVPVEQLVTELGQLANAGIKGSDAGTSLRTMLLRLGAPTDKAREAIEELGVQVFNAQGEFLPMPRIIDQFSRATRGMSDEQRTAAFQTIFGTDAIRAANIILRGGRDANERMAEAVGRQGAAADLAAAKMKGYKGALEGFKSTVETFAISLGERLLPAATTAIEKLSGVVGFLDRIATAPSLRVAVRIALEGLGNLKDALSRALFGTGPRRVRVPIEGGRFEFQIVQQQGLIDKLQALMGDVFSERAMFGSQPRRVRVPIEGGRFQFELRGGTVGWVNQFAAAIEAGASATDWNGAANAIAGGIGDAIPRAARGFVIIAVAIGRAVATAIREVDWINVGREIAAGIGQGLKDGLTEAGRGLPGTPEELVETLGLKPRGKALSLRDIWEKVTPEQFVRDLGLRPGQFDPLKAESAQAATRINRDWERAMARVRAAGAASLADVRAQLADTSTSGLRAKDRIEEIVPRIANAASRAGQAGRDVGAKASGGLEAGLRPLPGRVSARMGEALNAVGARRGAFESEGASLGGSIVSGVVNGLASLFGRVSSAIAGAVRGAIDFVKRNLGSTAEEYARKQLGDPLVKGIEEGIVGGQPILVAALRRSIRGAISQAGFARFSQLAQQIFGGRQAAATTRAEREIAAIERRREVEALQTALREAVAAGDQAAAARAQQDIRLFNLREQAERQRAALEQRQFLAQLRFQERLERLGRLLERRAAGIERLRELRRRLTSEDLTRAQEIRLGRQFVELNRQLAQGRLSIRAERRAVRRFGRDFKIDVNINGGRFMNRRDARELAKTIGPYIGQQIAYTIEAR